MSRKRISLATSAASIDVLLDRMADLDCQHQDVIITPMEAVENFTESTGCQVMLPAIKLDDILISVDPTTLTLVCPAGTKETSLYVITPVFGSKPRWFEKRLLSGWGQNEKGEWYVSLPKKGIKDRGLLALAQ